MTLRNRPIRRSLAGIIAVVAVVVGLLPGTPAQASTGPIYYQIVNMQTDECLAVSGGSTQHAANVVVSRCDGSESQMWYLESAGGGYQYIKARHSGMCLNVANWGQADGSDVVQAVCSGSTNERWHRDSTAVPPGHERLFAAHSGKCLDKAWNGDVVQWQCWGYWEWWQHWKFADLGVSSAA
jgi:hypothetical protein